MNRSLNILVDEHWPQPPAAEWVLLDARGEVVERGCSEPQHWPPADSRRAVLAGAQCVWMEVVLPLAARRELPRLVAYALEAHLVRDPETQHVTVTHRRDGGNGRRTGAMVVSRARLRQIVAQFEHIGHPLDHVHAALQTAAAANDRWTLTLGPCGGVLRPGPQAGIAVDTGDTASLLAQLELLAEHARRDETLPRALDIYGGLASVDTAMLEDRLGMRVDTLPTAAWWHDDATDLLHGEFAPRRRSGALWPRLRRPFALAAAAAIVLAITALVDVIARSSERDHIETRMARLLSDALPGTPAVAPAAQLARALADARRSHGELAPDDLLALFAAHVGAGGPPPRVVDYRDARLTLELAGAPNSGLVSRLDAAGIDAEIAGSRLTLELAR